MSGARRWVLVAAVVVAAVVAFVIANPGGGGSGTSTSTSPTATTAPPQIPTIQVKNGKPVGGIQKIEFKKGGRVRFRVVSDVADEIHVHGYDLKKDVPAGGGVSFDFPATIDGGFVIELEARGEQIAELTVQP